MRKKARFNVYFDKVDIEKLVQTVSDATCRTFILGDNVRGKISIIGPDNGKVDVSADEFYAAFLSALDANQLAVVPQGRFSKIVEKAKAKQNSIPVVGPGRAATPPTSRCSPACSRSATRTSSRCGAWCSSWSARTGTPSPSSRTR